MNARDILFRTNRFNLSVRKPHFINPDCFGEDLASWLSGKLLERGVEVPRSGQEDWGWYLKVKKGKDSYLLGMNGIPDETVPTDLGEWRIIVKKSRSVGQWLSGRGHIVAADAMLIMIEEILGAEADFSDVHQENGLAVNPVPDSNEGRALRLDPQSDEVTYPDGTTKAGPSRVSLWILGSFGLLFGAVFVYSGRVASSGTRLLFYVFAGFCVLMATACYMQARR